MKKNSLLASVLLLVSLLVTIFYLQPLIGHDSELDVTVGQAQDTLDIATQKLEAAKQAKDHFDHMTELDKQKMLLQIPTSLTQQNIIDDLSRIAALNNLGLVSITFAKNTTQDSLKKISVVANLSGLSQSYQTLLTLLQSVERNNRLLVVKNLSATMSSSRNDYSLTMEAYYK
jgi:Tfp pilus assembly protein PilO